MSNKNNKWIRPWNVEKFDNLSNRDERFFAILTKGVLAWLNQNIIMYNKPINHFIFNTGSSYLYMESNGYEYKMNETSGEDAIYMQMPRCIVTPGSIHIPTEELTSSYAHGQYERYDGNEIKGFNADLRRIPIEWDFTLAYIFSNYNEAIIVAQELVDCIIFQKYFKINYLGQIINCSIEIGGDFNIEFDKIDMTNPDNNQKTINLSIKVCSNYPVINEKSESSNGLFIEAYHQSMSIGESDSAFRGDEPDEINND